MDWNWVGPYLFGYFVAMLGYETGFLRRLKDVLREGR